MKRISKKHAIKLINENKGAIFSASYVKVDGSLRDITCRLGVTKHLKGGKLAFNPTKLGMLPVFDLQAKGYRMLRVNTMYRLAIAGKQFTVA
jgi:hypothetical protein